MKKKYNIIIVICLIIIGVSVAMTPSKTEPGEKERTQFIENENFFEEIQSFYESLNYKSVFVKKNYDAGFAIIDGYEYSCLGFEPHKYTLNHYGELSFLINGNRIGIEEILDSYHSITIYVNPDTMLLEEILITVESDEDYKNYVIQLIWTNGREVEGGDKIPLTNNWAIYIYGLT